MSALNLYRQLWRAANGFASYSYRSYALRRIGEEFRKNRNLNPTEAAEVRSSNWGVVSRVRV